MTVELVMRVARGEDDRLTGSVRLGENGAPREFSGTLELMRVFEDLVPAPVAPSGARGGRASEAEEARP